MNSVIHIPNIAVMLFIIVQVPADKTSLRVGALLELSHYQFERYFNFFIEILEDAFTEIENRTYILPGYSLKLVPKDTKVFMKLFLFYLSQLMRLWHLSSSVNSFFKRACAAIQWG